MAPLSSPRRPGTAAELAGPSTPQVDNISAPGATPALDILVRQVQQLVDDQALSQQQVQQMHASQAVVQCQMQALLAQLQPPTQLPPPTHQAPPPPPTINPAAPPAPPVPPQM